MMRRTFSYEKETELLRLCRLKKWGAARARSVAHPQEAHPTSSAYRGIETTALAVAVKLGAPLGTVRAILGADPDQMLRVRHSRRGTTLHEATRYRASLEVISYLTEFALVHTEHVQKGVIPFFGQVDDLGRTCLHHMVDWTLRSILSPRTAMTAVVDTTDNSIRIKTKNRNKIDDETMLKLCRKMASAYPEAVAMADIDGYTPLTLILATPPPSTFLCTLDGGGTNERTEQMIHELVKVLLSVSPEAAELSIPSPSVMGLQSATAAAKLRNKGVNVDNRHVCESSGTGKSKRSVKGAQKRTFCVNFGPNALYYALIGRRSLPIIEALLTATSTGGHSSCTAIVTSDLEHPLHVAITMRAPVEVVRLLLRHGPETAAGMDRHGLTPIDCAWIRSVVDRQYYERRGEGTTTEPEALPLIKSSQRRSLHVDYLRDWEAAADEISSLLESLNSSANRRRSYSSAFRKNQFSITFLWETLSVMLPLAARVAYDESPPLPESRYSKNTKWPFVHAASYLAVPKPVLDLSIYHHPDQVKQIFLGKLPIHFAAARTFDDVTHGPVAGTVQYAGGWNVAHRPHEKASPILELIKHHPGGLSVPDSEGALPLHIALDMIKDEARKAEHVDRIMAQVERAIGGTIYGARAPPLHRHKRRLGVGVVEDEKEAAQSTIEHIVAPHVEALERQDGRSRLYPFMQAAVGDYAEVDIIFILLQQNPNVVSFHLKG